MDKEQVLAFLATDEGKALVEGHEATTALRQTKDSILSQNHALKDKLKSFEGLGDVDTLNAALELYRAEQEKNKKTGDDKTNAELAHLRQQLEKEQNARKQREDALVRSFIDKEIVAGIASEKGVPELLTHIVSGRIRGSLQEDGSINVEVLGSDGQLSFKNGKPASINDLVQEIKANPVYGRAFDADDTQGAGSRPSKGTKPGVITDMNDPSFDLDKAMRLQKRKV